MTLVQHSSKSNEHYTPSWIIEPARELMGGIDLDPASSAIANNRVRAEHYFTAASNGLELPWFKTKSMVASRVFLNPPGGKAKGIPSMQKAFWYKLIDEYLRWNVKQAVFLAFSIELLQTSQNGQDNPAYWCTSYPFCIPRTKVKYIDTEGNPQNSPPNASAIIYIPPKKGDVIEAYQAFVELFSPIGSVVIPSQQFC